MASNWIKEGIEQRMQFKVAPPPSQVVICIPTWNNEAMLRQCLESIRRYTRACPYRIVVVNNGSTDGTTEWLDGQGVFSSNERPMTSIRLPENLGFIKASNLALKQVKPNEHALLLNDDTQITDPFWLERMVQTLESDDAIGAVGPTSNYVLGWQSVEYSAHLPMQHDTKFLIGFCMLISNRALAKVGLLDERFGMGMNEDLDYSIRLAEAGYRLLVDRSVFVLHYGSGSIKRLDESFADQEMRTRQMLLNKWGEDTVQDLFSPMETDHALA